MTNEDKLTEEKQKPNKMIVVGYNLLALFIYTLISRFIEDGMFLDAFILAIHFFACLIIAIAVKKWVWVFSAFVVLTIGFSTCVGFLSFRL